ncbi:MAG: ATP-binding protein, partial [Desulfovibrionales bacterium]
MVRESQAPELEKRIQELEQQLLDLRQSTFLTHSIINKSPVVAFVWRNQSGWPVEHVTDNVLTLCGYAPEEFTSGKVRYSDLIHPEDLDRVSGEVLACSRKRSCEAFTHKPYRIVTRSGRIRWVEDETSITRDDQGRVTRFQGIVQDVTPTVLAEMKLEENQQFLENVIESIQEGVCVLDRDMVILLANEVIAGWYDSQGGLEGKKCFECFHNATQPCEPCPSLRSMHSGRTEHEIMPGLPGSPVEWVEIFSYPIRNRQTGEPQGVVEFVRDITEKKKMEHQLLESRKLEALGTLAGGLAHDFNNLLMGIQGQVSLMLTDVRDKTLEQSLKSIEEYVRSASQLTRQLLGMARGGKYEVKVVQINAVVEKMLSVFGRTHRDIFLRSSLDDTIPDVEADRGQIEQVLLNILLNAAQAMPEGGDITVTTSAVAIVAKEEREVGLEPGRYVQISITDTGFGMDDAIRERIFDPFFTTKGIGQGAGLGLASAYGIIKSHKGAIDVKSEPGHGSTFLIFLPASTKQQEAQAEHDEELCLGSGMVLLIDDEQFMIDVATKMLEKLGYIVVSRNSGAEALAFFRENHTAVDLVILDIIMPGMSGSEVFDGLMEIDPEVKVLLSSGYSIHGQVEEILKRGGAGFIQKPYSLQELSRKVRECLEQVQEI